VSSDLFQEKWVARARVKRVTRDLSPASRMGSGLAKERLGNVLWCLIQGASELALVKEDQASFPVHRKVSELAESGYDVYTLLRSFALVGGLGAREGGADCLPCKWSVITPSW
jgi:hypothetical protein